MKMYPLQACSSCPHLLIWLYNRSFCDGKLPNIGHIYRLYRHTGLAEHGTYPVPIFASAAVTENDEDTQSTQLLIKGQFITPLNKVRDLGVIVDSELSMDVQTQNVVCFY